MKDVTYVISSLVFMLIGLSTVAFGVLVPTLVTPLLIVGGSLIGALGLLLLIVVALDI